MMDWEYSDIPCPRCGAVPTKMRDSIEIGCEDGYIDLYDQDPSYYFPGEDALCPSCHGVGVVRWCGECGHEIWLKEIDGE
jgi:hypothetical protein